MTKTLVINNQKGGVGKTMLAVHAAWFLAEAGASVLVVDLDPQANASYTLSTARQSGLAAQLFLGPTDPLEAEPGISLLAADQGLYAVEDDLTRSVLAFRSGFSTASQAFDYVVIDTPPTWSGRNYAALMVASSLIVPIDLETYALQGVKQVLVQKASVEKTARGGRPIDFLGLLPCRFQSTSPRQRDNLRALLRDQGLRILYPDHGVLTQRQGYAEALDLKTPVWTIKKTAAHQAGLEIRAILHTMKQRLDALPS